MPQGPAARVGDPVVHPLPPVLGPGPGSVTVLIGGMPAWRGMPLAAAAGLMSAKAASDVTVATAVAASTAAAGTPGAPAAIAAETTAKQAATASMTSAMSAAGAGADTHMCATPFPPTVPSPHSQGMVVTGSITVMINNLPACRAGDTILECMGPPNSIAMGCPTVIIGDSMYMGLPGGPAGGLPSTRIVNLVPQDPANPGWGLTPAHLKKHLVGNGPTALRQIDPGGTTEKWSRHLAELLQSPVTGTTSNGMLDVVKSFPRADGSGVFKMGARLAPKPDGTFDLITVLTKQ